MDVLVGLAIIGAVLAVVVVMVAKGPRYRRGGAVLNVYEEIYHPGAQLARDQVQVQEQRVTPSPTPDRYRRGE
jgi:hypothetical protein